MTIEENIRVLPNIAQRKMVASNEYERLRQLLRSRLTESGWRDQVTQLCKQVVAEDNIYELTVEDIVERVTPQARSLVPATVKKELLQKIKNFFLEESNFYASHN